MCAAWHALAWLRRYDSWQPTYNPSTRRMEQRIVTTWRRLPVTGDWQRTYEGDEPGMQARSVTTWLVAHAWRLLLHPGCGKAYKAWRDGMKTCAGRWRGSVPHAGHVSTVSYMHVSRMPEMSPFNSANARL